MNQIFSEVLFAGTAESLYGQCTVVFSGNSIFALGFCSLNEAMDEFGNYFKGKNIETDHAKAAEVVKSIFENGIMPEVILQGTDFQMLVWNELMKIPVGSTITYSELARNIGKPKSARAVGNAVGANLISFLVPCHRVTRSDGTLGGYRWGTDIKKQIIDIEKSTRIQYNQN